MKEATREEPAGLRRVLSAARISWWLPGVEVGLLAVGLSLSRLWA